MNVFEYKPEEDNGFEHGMRKICVGCPAVKVADQLASENDPGQARELAIFFNDAFNAARDAICEKPRASHREIDQNMGDLSPRSQDKNKRLGNLDRSTISTMAKNCAVMQTRGICAFNTNVNRMMKPNETN